MSNRNPEEKEKQGQWKKPGDETARDPNREQKQQQQPKPQPTGPQPGQKPPQRPGQPRQEEEDPSKRKRA